LPELGIVIGAVFVNVVVAEAGTVTASEASEQRTDSRISLRTTGKRVILPIHMTLETVSIIRAPFPRVALVIS
jgi:hypothetical protein